MYEDSIPIEEIIFVACSIHWFHFWTFHFAETLTNTIYCYAKFSKKTNEEVFLVMQWHGSWQPKHKDIILDIICGCICNFTRTCQRLHSIQRPIIFADFLLLKSFISIRIWLIHGGSSFKWERMSQFVTNIIYWSSGSIVLWRDNYEGSHPIAWATIERICFFKQS